MRLCAEARWDDEKACIESICHLVADLCTEMLLPDEDAVRAATKECVLEGGPGPTIPTTEIAAAIEAGEFEDVVSAAAGLRLRKRQKSASCAEALQTLRWLHESVRRDAACRWPSTLATDGTFLDLVSLDQLYRVFERC